MELLKIEQVFKSYKEHESINRNTNKLPLSLQENKLPQLHQMNYIKEEVNKLQQYAPRLEYFEPLIQREFKSKILREEFLQRLKQKKEKKLQRKLHKEKYEAHKIDKVIQSINDDIIYGNLFSSKNTQFSKKLQENFKIASKLNEINKFQIKQSSQPVTSRRSKLVSQTINLNLNQQNLMRGRSFSQSQQHQNSILILKDEEITPQNSNVNDDIQQFEDKEIEQLNDNNQNELQAEDQVQGGNEEQKQLNRYNSSYTQIEPQINQEQIQQQHFEENQQQQQQNEIFIQLQVEQNTLNPVIINDNSMKRIQQNNSKNSNVKFNINSQTVNNSQQIPDLPTQDTYTSIKPQLKYSPQKNNKMAKSLPKLKQQQKKKKKNYIESEEYKDSFKQWEQKMFKQYKYNSKYGVLQRDSSKQQSDQEKYIEEQIKQGNYALVKIKERKERQKRLQQALNKTIGYDSDESKQNVYARFL